MTFSQMQQSSVQHDFFTYSAAISASKQGQLGPSLSEFFSQMQLSQFGLTRSAATFRHTVLPSMPAQEAISEPRL